MAFDKNKYKSVVESGYKTVLGFYEAMRYLYTIVGDKKINAAKEGIKILKHHEKTKTLKLPLASIYYYFSLFYKVTGDLDLSVEYDVKTNEQYYTNEPDETKKNEYLLKIATGYLSLSLKNNKIKDKKLLLQSIDCFDKYLNNTKKPANLHYFKNLHNILEEVYASDTYKVKSYAKAKIISNLFDKKYFDLFTKEDFEFYLDYLKRTNLIFNKENHYNYTLGLYSYKFNSTDYDNQQLNNYQKLIMLFSHYNVHIH